MVYTGATERLWKQGFYNLKSNFQNKHYTNSTMLLNNKWKLENASHIDPKIKWKILKREYTKLVSKGRHKTKYLLPPFLPDYFALDNITNSKSKEDSKICLSLDKFRSNDNFDC